MDQDADADADLGQIVKAANASRNLLVEAGVTCDVANKSDPSQTYPVTCFYGNTLPPSISTQIWDIFVANMKVMYEQSPWGFDEAAKRKELLKHPLNRYLIVTRSEEVVAYASIRFTYDDEDEPEHPVAYCYELQVRADCRGQGIGAQIMRMVQHVARHFRMWKTMLTTLKSNTEASAFYAKIGFGIDANSPSSFGHNDECYEILSDKPKRR